MSKIKVTLVRSTNSSSKKQIANVQALGLRKISDYAIHEANPAILGMVNKVSHLLKVCEHNGEEA